MRNDRSEDRQYFPRIYEFISPVWYKIDTMARLIKLSFQKKLKENKDREFAIIQEMESHAKADESFHNHSEYDLKFGSTL